MQREKNSIWQNNQINNTLDIRVSDYPIKTCDNKEHVSNLYQVIDSFRKNITFVSKTGGVILLITGILIITNQLQALGYYLLDIFPFLQKFG